GDRVLGSLDIYAQTAFHRRLRRDRTDRHDERLRRGPVTEHVAEIRHRRRRRERERVYAAATHPFARGGGGRRGHRWIDGEHVHVVAAVREAGGENVAGLRGPGQQHALAVGGRGREGLEQRLGDEPLGKQVGAHPAVGEGGGGARPDRGHLQPGEGAGVEP